MMRLQLLQEPEWVNEKWTYLGYTQDLNTAYRPGCSGTFILSNVKFGGHEGGSVNFRACSPWVPPPRAALPISEQMKSWGGGCCFILKKKLRGPVLAHIAMCENPSSSSCFPLGGGTFHQQWNCCRCLSPLPPSLPFALFASVSSQLRKINQDKRIFKN